MGTTHVAAADFPTLGFIVRASDANAPTTPARMARGLFGTSATTSPSVASFWRANSHGAINLVGTVHPAVLVSAHTAVTFRCGDWQEAKALLVAAGVDVASYKLLVMIHSSNAGCSRGSGGELAGQGVIRINGGASVSQTAHEVGHALPKGVAHASSIACTPGRPRCTRDEYGYYGDVMGKGDRLGSSNVVHRLQLVIIDRTRYAVHSAAAGVSVQYVIRPLTAPEGTIGVRLGGGSAYASTAPTLDTATWIEYRQPVGIDATSHAGLLKLFRGALVLRVGTGSDKCRPCLVDTHPLTGDKFDSSVLPGESWIEEGYRIETLTATPDALTVRITKL